MKKLLFILTLIGVFVAEARGVPEFPGTVIAQSPDPFELKVGSPSIVVLPDGRFIASHDWGGTAVNGTYTSVYVSHNRGDSWEHLSTLEGIRWAGLFYHQDKLYLLGVKSSFGDICIRMSSDFGISWTEATNSKSGLLFKGRFHTAPVPVLVHNGRIWRSFEESPDELNNRDFHSFVISAPVGANLLDASSWRKSSTVRFDPLWINASNREWLEGNVVVTPENKLVNILRLNSEQEINGKYELECPADAFERYEIAAKANISEDGTVSEFNPYNDYISIPGALSKFTIRYDSVTGKYWTIANKITNTDFKFLGASNSPRNQRNVLVLYYSFDLYEWHESYIVARWREGDMLTRRETIGFQYADWQFDGDNIVAVVRTSWFAEDWHNSNIISFHTIENFRNIQVQQSPPDLKSLTESKDPILEWSFNKSDIKGNEISAASTFTHNRLLTSQLTRGPGLKNSSQFPLSFSATTHLTAIENNKKAKAIEDGQYYAFSVRAKEGYSVSLSTLDVSLSRNIDGPTSYRWQYSFDNTNFNEISSGDVFDFYDNSGEGEQQPTVRLGQYSDLQEVPYTKEVFFRIYFWRATSTAGRIAIGKAGKGVPSLVVGGHVEKLIEEPFPLVSWDLSGLKGVTANDVIATGIDEGIQPSNLLRGAGLSPVSLNSGYYSYLSSYGAGKNLKEDALQNEDYYAFQIRSKENMSLALSKLKVKLRRNKNGPTSFRWYYRINGGDLIPLGRDDAVLLSNNDAGTWQIPVDLSKEILLQQLRSEDVVEFRLYAWGAASAVGGFAIGRSIEENSLELYGVVKEEQKVLVAWQFHDASGVISTGREAEYGSTLHESVLPATLIRGAGNNVTSSGHIGGFIGYLTESETKTEAIENGSYFEFTLKPEKDIHLHLKQIRAKLRRQEFSAYMYRWFYKINDAEFREIGDTDITMSQFDVNQGYIQHPIPLENEKDLKNLSPADNVTFRLYAWGGRETDNKQIHFGFGQSKLEEGPALAVIGSVNNVTSIMAENYLGQDQLRVYFFDNKLYAEYIAQNESTSFFEIRDLTGRVQFRKRYELLPGRNLFELSVQLKRGVYILTANGQVNHYIKFINK